MRYYAILIVVTAVATCLLCWGVYRLAMRHRWYPAVRERDVHATPKPRLGGIAMYIGFLGSLALGS